jgi:peptidylprolyl isomerase
MLGLLSGRNHQMEEPMVQAKLGDRVKVHYTGRLIDGQVFDSSQDRAPIEFKIGDKMVIPGFESAVIGMTLGENKTVTIESENAYGPYMTELVTSVDREQFPQHIAPQIGQQLEIKSDEGFEAIVTVTEVTDATVTLDANHPLAGKNLVFEIELVEIA